MSLTVLFQGLCEGAESVPKQSADRSGRHHSPTGFFDHQHGWLGSLPENIDQPRAVVLPFGLVHFKTPGDISAEGIDQEGSFLRH